MISGYLCNKCGQNDLAYLKTGNVLETSYHSGQHLIHSSSHPRKPANGFFFDTGTSFYQSGANAIGQLGFVEVELGGGVNAYLHFDAPMGKIEFSGVPYGDSTFGKAVLIKDPVHIHWFPATGFNSNSGICANCYQMFSFK
jgi:hypothetical protein